MYKFFKFIRSSQFRLRFEIMHDYINKWRTVMTNELFHEFSKVSNDENTWQVRCAADFLIADLDNGADAGRHGLTFHSYKEAFGCARELSFTRSYYIGSSVEN